MANLTPITVETTVNAPVDTTVNAPVDTVWACWTEPKHIMQWNQASTDWHTTSATNDLRDGGSFTSRMEAKDKSFGFDFGGTYTRVLQHKHIAYVMSDGRKVSIDFASQDGRTRVTETFDPEAENSPEMQKQGWQAIMESFRKYAEAQK